MREPISKFDRFITTYLYHRPAVLLQPFEWITLLGHPVVVSFIAAFIAIVGMGLDRPRLTISFIVALIALAAGSALKFVLRRPRPITPYAQNMKQRTFSFPSGHAYGAGIIYGLILVLALENFIAPWGSFVTVGLSALIILIGLSRIYLGAHYFLDVVGGWLLAIPVVYVIAEHLL